ncbi:hypothetical protein BSLA_03r0201 [Burkholderia stabilis]|nr:hypothetical protein BSLA_03r0201 [Burkholderia stabilis]
MLSRYVGTMNELFQDVHKNAVSDSERAMPRNPDNVCPEHFTWQRIT